MRPPALLSREIGGRGWGREGPRSETAPVPRGGKQALSRTPLPGTSRALPALPSAGQGHSTLTPPTLPGQHGGGRAVGPRARSRSRAATMQACASAPPRSEPRRLPLLADTSSSPSLRSLPPGSLLRSPCLHHYMYLRAGHTLPLDCLTVFPYGAESQGQGARLTPAWCLANGSTEGRKTHLAQLITGANAPPRLRPRAPTVPAPGKRLATQAEEGTERPLAVGAV